MQIILHVGMHKTGSTAIQKAMRRYDDGETVYARLGDANHSTAFHAAFSENYNNYHVFRHEGLPVSAREQIHLKSLSNIKNYLSSTNRRRVIFSGEGITGIEMSGITRMFETLGAYSKDIRVIGYVRPPIDFAKSNIQQVVRNGGTELHRAMQPRYRNRFSKLVDQVGENAAMLLSFDRQQLKGGDILDDFADRLGLDRKRMGASSANSSISFEAQKCAYLLNASDTLRLGDPKLNAARDRFIRLLDRVLPRKEQPDPSVFLPHFDRPDIAWMSNRLGKPLVIPNNPASPASLKETYSAISDDTVGHLLDILRFGGVKAEFDRDPTALVCRIFYLCLRGSWPPSFYPHSPRYILDDPIASFLGLKQTRSHD